MITSSATTLLLKYLNCHQQLYYHIWQNLHSFKVKSLIRHKQATCTLHTHTHHSNVHDLDGFTDTLDQSTDTAVPMADNKHRLSLWIQMGCHNNWCAIKRIITYHILVDSWYASTEWQPSARACDLTSVRTSFHHMSLVSGSSSNYQWIICEWIMKIITLGLFHFTAPANSYSYRWDNGPHGLMEGTKCCNSAKQWRGKTLEKWASFANILPSQIP